MSSPSLAGRGILAVIALWALAGAGARAAEAPTVVWKLADLPRVGGLAAEVLGAPRVVEGAAIFDGAHDGVFIPSIPLAGAKQFTIEILFQPARDGPEAQRFVHVQDVKAFRAMIEIRVNRTGGWWLDTFLGTGPASQGVGVALIDPQRVHPTDQWYWAALRYDGKTMTDFVNGEKELEAPGNFPAFADGKISLGVRQNKVFWFKGGIREVRFTPEALPAEKLQRVK